MFLLSGRFGFLSSSRSPAFGSLEEESEGLLPWYLIGTKGILVLLLLQGESKQAGEVVPLPRVADEAGLEGLRWFKIQRFDKSVIETWGRR